MRNAFADEITQLGDDPRVVLLSADIGNRLFDRFKSRHAARFINTGIAEANTISMAAGLASFGFRPVCYTIAPFITARCYEQLKLDVAYHRMPVVIIGTGSGLSYASLGPTHHSLEDIALMRTLPGMQIFAPADSQELRSCLRIALNSTCPTYIRIGKKGEPLVFSEPPALSAGSWISLREGRELALLSTGNLLPTAIAAGEQLAHEGHSVAVFSCASVQPLDAEALSRLARMGCAMVTLEEHGTVGGFGAAVAEWLVEHGSGSNVRLIRCDGGAAFLHGGGEQSDARRHLGLGEDQIVERIRRSLFQRTRRTEF